MSTQWRSGSAGGQTPRVLGPWAPGVAFRHPGASCCGFFPWKCPAPSLLSRGRGRAVFCFPSAEVLAGSVGSCFPSRPGPLTVGLLAMSSGEMGAWPLSVSSNPRSPPPPVSREETRGRNKAPGPPSEGEAGPVGLGGCCIQEPSFREHEVHTLRINSSARSTLLLCIFSDFSFSVTVRERAHWEPPRRRKTRGSRGQDSQAPGLAWGHSSVPPGSGLAVCRTGPAGTC